jgi:hypothetical protein
MSNTNSRSVDVESTRTSRVSIVALILGLLAVPGSTLTWSTRADDSFVWPGGGFAWGAPLAIAAVAVGVHAVRRGAPARRAAVAGVVLGAAMIAMLAIWTIVESL